MSDAKRNRAALIGAALMVALLFSTGPAAAKTAGQPGKNFSFTALAKETKSATARLTRLLLGRGGKRPAKQSVIAAVPKGEGQAAVQTQASLASMPAGAAKIRVFSSGPFTTNLPSPAPRVLAGGADAAVAFADGVYYLVVDGKQVSASRRPIKFSPAGPSSPLVLPDYRDLNWNKTVNLNVFRGRLEIVFSPKSNRLWAVNEVDFEDYLKGIAEADNSAPEEHLKVMAVIARSYALHHLNNGGRHPGEPFHLKNSCNGNGDDQIYRGYLAEARQPRIAAAASGTAGTVVTYNGQPVITPYSTRAGGRTRSPAEAGWRVDWPWVQSVPDPDTAGMSRLGHGVGLSGYGSRRRAERGESAAQILSYYFPGTALGQATTAGKVLRVAIYSQGLP